MSIVTQKWEEILLKQTFRIYSLFVAAGASKLRIKYNAHIQMKIVFRTDASASLGTGHVMRCLTLAESLKRVGAEVIFICAKNNGDMTGFLEERGYEVGRINKPYGSGFLDDAEQTVAHIKNSGVKPDWLVVDNHALDNRWKSIIRPDTGKIMVIDDLADRPHDCDLLLDQNYYERTDRYKNLTPKKCKLLLGPEYALLREEFYHARQGLEKRSGNAQRILISMGGADSSNETAKALEAIRMVNLSDISVDVVTGAANPHADMIREMCHSMLRTNYHHAVDNMAKLMATTDLAIGSVGVATWERLCVGLPAIVIVTAKNQIEHTRSVESTGAIINLGWYSDVTPADIGAAITHLLADRSRLVKMSEEGMKYVDGAGVNKVCGEMLGN
ncbi:Pseudaminic acid cytidylyltransferase [hydrothermal vent metagenome]|uniref:Pseudaminic acid cytidylyltransferase n=1 Tax=hydrothermal vent metagenome TaxID=652676 RepID=A0A3B1BX36_9ZZZZ